MFPIDLQKVLTPPHSVSNITSHVLLCRSRRRIYIITVVWIEETHNHNVAKALIDGIRCELEEVIEYFQENWGYLSERKTGTEKVTIPEVTGHSRGLVWSVTVMRCSIDTGKK